MEVVFHGVRGSVPRSSPANLRYGANTSSVALYVDPEPPILIDLGTGLSAMQPTQLAAIARDLRARALLTHLHSDHIQGLPFFAPVHTRGFQLDIYGPTQAEGSLRAAIGAALGPPYFPLRLDDWPAAIRCHEVGQDEFTLGNAQIMARWVPHLGPTLGFRVCWGGATVAYLSDHQAPADMALVAESVLELCQGVDLLIHDAQYTPAEFATRSDWGHSTADYALFVAQQAGARRLCLFHHDPWRSDDDLDQIVDEAIRKGSAMGLQDVIGAAERTTVTL